MPEFENDRLGILHGITQLDATSGHGRSADSQPRRSKHSSKRQRSLSEDRGGSREDDGKCKGPRHSKFHFKKKHRSSRHSRNSEPKQETAYHAPLGDDPAEYDDTYIPNTASWKHAANPDAAFRESLFDAMADDEGAAFWEGVYGQPVHIYERPEAPDDKGHLEKMTDEEYARYVREKMWEKSHEHILEERRRREERQEQEKKEREQERKEWEAAERESRHKERIRREQKLKDKFQRRWTEYLADWKTISREGVQDTDGIPWPVASGRLEDVAKTAVERFMLAAPTNDELTLQDILKGERIRWHPDKAQQRWGKLGLDGEELRAITAVFQTLDEMWTERRQKAES